MKRAILSALKLLLSLFKDLFMKVSATYYEYVRVLLYETAGTVLSGSYSLLRRDQSICQHGRCYPTFTKATKVNNLRTKPFDILLSIYVPYWENLITLLIQ